MLLQGEGGVTLATAHWQKCFYVIRAVYSHTCLVQLIFSIFWKWDCLNWKSCS